MGGLADDFGVTAGIAIFFKTPILAHFGRALVLLCVTELFLNSNHPALCMPFFRSFTFFYVCTISLFVRLSQHVCKPRKNALRKPLYSIYYVLHTVCHILMLYTIYYIPYAIHYLPYIIYTIYFIQCTIYCILCITYFLTI